MTESAPDGSKRWCRQRNRIVDYIYASNGAVKKEIMAEFKISVSTVGKIMAQLIEAGEIAKGCDMVDGKIDERKILYLPGE